MNAPIQVSHLMTAHIGTKTLLAVAMTRGQYNAYRGWDTPSNENPEDPGYLVEYTDGGQQWAKSVGGDAPSPEECALIKANCPDVLTRWIWTNKTHADDASFAWLFLSDGDTGNGRKSAAGGALAVRMIQITA